LRSATQEIGALVFSTTVHRPDDPRMLAQLAQIGIQLGQWFHRQDAERRLRRSEERFRALMESAPDSIVITDEGGRMTMANRQTEKLFGWTRDQLIGQPIEMLMPMRFRTRHLDHRDQYSSHPRTRPMGIGMELAALRADGTEFPVEISLSPIQIDGQKLVSAAIRDASERRQMERTQHRLHQLEMAQAEHLATVGQLAAGMAHEIKNPLAGMSAALEVLASQCELPAFAQEIMGEIQHQATRIRRIVDELLNYARPRPAEMILADLNATVEQAIPFATRQAQTHGVKVAFHPASIPPLLHDPEQLHRLVLNLLVNAVDASSAGGSVELSTAMAPEGNAVVVCVSDHGSGIPPEDLERIFDPFFTTKGSRGTGLGLSLCRRIAELHAATLSVASRPGEGSRFTLTLPIDRPHHPGTDHPGVHFVQTEDPDR
jgi:protein-histidine pros-kinase